MPSSSPQHDCRQADGTVVVSKKSNATVTIAHSRSKDLPAICRRADISSPPSAARKWSRADWVKAGAVVIDVGINRIEDASKKIRLPPHR